GPDLLRRRLMAGQRILDPLIGVRIPAPELLSAEYRRPVLGLLLRLDSVHFVDSVQSKSNPCAGTELYECTKCTSTVRSTERRSRGVNRGCAVSDGSRMTQRARATERRGASVDVRQGGATIARCRGTGAAIAGAA